MARAELQDSKRLAESYRSHVESAAAELQHAKEDLVSQRALVERSAEHMGGRKKGAEKAIGKWQGESKEAAAVFSVLAKEHFHP